MSGTIRITPEYVFYKDPETNEEYKISNYDYVKLEKIRNYINIQRRNNIQKYTAIPQDEINILKNYVQFLYEIKTILFNNKLELNDLELLTLITYDKEIEISDEKLEIYTKDREELEELTMLINSSKNFEKKKLEIINKFNNIPSTYFNKLELFVNSSISRKKILRLKNRIEQRIEKFENILRIIYTREKELLQQEKELLHSIKPKRVLQAINEDNSHLRQPSRLQSITPINEEKSVSRTPSRLQSITPINEDITQDKEEEPYYRFNKAGGFKKKVKQLKKYLKESNK